MDKNNFDQLGFPVNDNSDDFGTTRELNSIHDADPEDPSGIAPRDRFTEMNSADDPGSTRMMDSLTACFPGCCAFGCRYLRGSFPRVEGDSRSDGLHRNGKKKP